MADPRERLELAIDTASAFTGVALSRRGAVLAELNWLTRNNHSTELIPAIDVLLSQAGVDRTAIGVLFVNRGPGGYAGLRVGISTAMGLALGLNAELVGVGRLELDAYQHAAHPGPICAVHQAGRGDVALALYVDDEGGWRELRAPGLGTPDAMLADVPPGTLFCGELRGLADRITAACPGARLAGASASLRRAGTLAELGWQRYSEGGRDNPIALEPLYLREPSITRPKPRSVPA